MVQGVSSVILLSGISVGEHVEKPLFYGDEFAQ